MDARGDRGDAMVSVCLYVEGGGDSDALRAACRRGFGLFFENAGLKGCRPRVVACGGRRNAYERYCQALREGRPALLLVDSEEAVAAACASGEPDRWQPWQHLMQRAGDEWSKPAGAVDDQCHLMVQCMESWFLADPETLKKFFGQGYEAGKIPRVGDTVESVAKGAVYDALSEATKHCKTKGSYGKGAHGFPILGMLDPAKVTAASPWADRFVAVLRRTMGCRASGLFSQ